MRIVKQTVQARSGRNVTDGWRMIIDLYPKSNLQANTAPLPPYPPPLHASCFSSFTYGCEATLKEARPVPYGKPDEDGKEGLECGR